LTGSAFVSVDFGYDLPKWTESVALTLLVREGIAAIWQLHLSAAKVHRDGHRAAATIIEIADAAEREWLRENGGAPR
jgi:hypothetical protein